MKVGVRDERDVRHGVECLDATRGDERLFDIALRGDIFRTIGE